MSKILLISSNITREPFPVYPLGMSIIAASLTKAGHQVTQYDYLQKGDESCAGILTEIPVVQPDFIGISVRNIDNVDSLATFNNWYLDHVKTLVDAIKERFNIPVIIGGPAFSIMPRIILDYTGADYGITGEGERALNTLISQLSQGEKPPRITKGSQPLINGNDFTPPLYDEKLVNYYMGESGILNYQTKRGCPHGCNYCSYPVIEGKRFRKQEPGFVADNLKRLKKDHGVDTVFFTDSVFNDSSGHYLEVAREMIRQRCDIKWAGYFRPSNTTEDNLHLLKESGLYAMEVGSDAACDTTLKGINKSFLFEDILEFNRISVKQEIPAAHFFMFGGPGETRETVSESLSNIEKLKKCVVFIFSGIRILPQTGIRDIAVRHGLLSEDNDLLRPAYYFSPLVDKKEVEDQILKSFKKRKDRIFPPEKNQARLNAMHLFGFKGLLWDRLISFSNQQEQGRRNHAAKTTKV